MMEGPLGFVPLAVKVAAVILAMSAMIPFLGVFPLWGLVEKGEQFFYWAIL